MDSHTKRMHQRIMQDKTICHSIRLMLRYFWSSTYTGRNSVHRTNYQLEQNIGMNKYTFKLHITQASCQGLQSEVKTSAHLIQHSTANQQLQVISYRAKGRQRATALLTGWSMPKGDLRGLQENVLQTWHGESSVVNLLPTCGRLYKDVESLRSHIVRKFMKHAALS